MIDYYEILEVSPKASPEVIKVVYQLLLQRYDFENSSKDPEKTQKLKAINLAYDVLSDPEKRKAYNLELNKAEKGANEFQRKHNAFEVVNENATKLSQANTTPVRNTESKKPEVSSILSRIKWNRWGWIVSILVVVMVLISMVQPDPSKALRGQLAVKLEAEREKKELEVELKKTATVEQKTDSIENKEKTEKVVKTQSSQNSATDVAP